MIYNILAVLAPIVFVLFAVVILEKRKSVNNKESNNDDNSGTS